MTYLPTLTNEELLRYAVPETELERELLKRWNGIIQEFAEREQEYKEEIHSLCKEVRQQDREIAALEESLYGFV